jgi:2-polyprenyl-6-hydroxyphenyl methylase/3-demethylubiquinone-9 3-methyltransferase
MNTWATEIRENRRFAFGQNWKRFLEVLDDDRIAASEDALCGMLEVADLRGLSFLDVGSGSGLSSLAAMRLGASQVHSFDFDPQGVACTEALRKRYFPDASNWGVEEGSVLDRDFIGKLGTFDIVYSWGVLHHTGSMWCALENIPSLVKPGGKLFIALYNDEGYISRLWLKVKRSYNRNFVWRSAIFIGYYMWLVSRGVAVDLVVRRENPMARYAAYGKERGMSFTRDVIDWIGGYPYEVARPEEIFDFYKKSGFVLTKLKTRGRGHGNNEFVFTKCAE